MQLNLQEQGLLKSKFRNQTIILQRKRSLFRFRLQIQELDFQRNLLKK